MFWIKADKENLGRVSGLGFVIAEETRVLFLKESTAFMWKTSQSDPKVLCSLSETADYCTNPGYLLLPGSRRIYIFSHPAWAEISEAH